MRPKYKLIII